jgi:hypothetical protein
LDRVHELKEIQDRLGKSTSDVIQYIEAKRATSRVINFQVNSIHMLTLTSPHQTTNFNGLCQLPNRVDLLTGIRSKNFEHKCENELLFERVDGEPIGPREDIKTETDQKPEFFLKRMRLK